MAKVLVLYYSSMVIKRVSDLMPYDAIIFGAPTRFGNLCAQIHNFLDQTGRWWINCGLIGKVGSVFTSTGRKPTTSCHTTLLHYSMSMLGVPYSWQEIMNQRRIAPMVPVHLPAAMVVVNRRTMKSKLPGYRAATLPRWPKSYRPNNQSGLDQATVCAI